ncbi:hypothetical protein ABFS83_05G104800 [Erythranthe nasuta]
MVGKNCFAIASDRRLGVQLQTIATDFQKIYRIHDKLFIGLAGLATDAQTLDCCFCHFYTVKNDGEKCFTTCYYSHI